MNPYKIQDLGAFNPSSLNNKGQIVGGCVDAKGFTHPFLWEDKNGLSPLTELPGCLWSFASDINDGGEIVGSSVFNNATPHATYWKNRIPEDLNVGTASQARSINNKGQIAGNTDKSCCTWINGVVNIKQPYNEDGSWGSSAQAIISNGQVFGNCFGGSESEAIAVKWDTNGKVHDLDLQIFVDPRERRICYVQSANDSEIAVGAIRALFSNQNHAYYWSPYGKGTLGDPPGYMGVVANDINFEGQVVGGSFSVSNYYRAVIWNDLIMTDLNSLIDPSLGWTLQDAGCINDRGQIAGVGLFKGEQRNWLISPDYGEIIVPPLYYQILFGLVSDGGGIQLLGPSNSEPHGGPFGRILDRIPKEYRPILKNIMEKQLIPKSKGFKSLK